MDNSSIYAVVLTDKAGIEFVRFGTSLHFEYRKEQHISGLKTGYFFHNGERKDYRFFHDERMLSACSRRTKDSLKARTAIRNQLVRQARTGQLKIDVRELFVGEPEVVALVERVLIHAFLYTSRIINHYNDRGGEVGGVEYHKPSSAAVAHKVREVVKVILCKFDASEDVRERAFALIYSWFNAKKAPDSSYIQKKLAQENARKARTACLFGLLKTAIAAGKGNGSSSKVLVKGYKPTCEKWLKQQKSGLSYPELMKAKSKLQEIEIKMKHHADIATMNHEDYQDMGGDDKVVMLKANLADADLLHDMLLRKQERDENMGLVQQLSAQLSELRKQIPK